MNEFILFLRGHYNKQHLSFYLDLVTGKTTMAIDGGYEFFAAADLVPDLLIGDFDSLPDGDGKLPKAEKTIRYPIDKDKTDAHLALEYCLEQNATSIDIVQPEAGELDHFLGNVFLLTSFSYLPKSERPLVRILSYESEIRCIENETIELFDREEDMVSIIPLSDSLTLTCRGVKYPAENLLLRRGESRGLRNMITSSRAVVNAKGQALIVRLRQKG